MPNKLTAREQIAWHLAEQGTSYTRVAHMMGVKRQVVTRLLTIEAKHRTVTERLLDLMDALGLEVEVTVARRR